MGWKAGKEVYVDLDSITILNGRESVWLKKKACRAGNFVVVE